MIDRRLIFLTKRAREEGNGGGKEEKGERSARHFLRASHCAGCHTRSPPSGKETDLLHGLFRSGVNAKAEGLETSGAVLRLCPTFLYF